MWMTSKYFEYQTVTFSMPARFTSWGNEMFANNNLTSETVGGLIYSRPYKTPKIMCVRIYQKIKVPKRSQYLNKNKHMYYVTSFKHDFFHVNWLNKGTNIWLYINTSQINSKLKIYIQSPISFYGWIYLHAFRCNSNFQFNRFSICLM